VAGQNRGASHYERALGRGRGASHGSELADVSTALRRRSARAAAGAGSAGGNDPMRPTAPRRATRPRTGFAWPERQGPTPPSPENGPVWAA